MKKRTLHDILNKRETAQQIDPEKILEPVEYAKPSEQIDFSADIMGISIESPEPIPEIPMTQTEVEAIESVIDSMSNLEKAVAVHSIPTEILQNEITRRIQRDKAAMKQIKSIVDAFEKY